MNLFEIIISEKKHILSCACDNSATAASSHTLEVDYINSMLSMFCLSHLDCPGDLNQHAFKLLQRSYVINKGKHWKT